MTFKTTILNFLDFRRREAIKKQILAEEHKVLFHEIESQKAAHFREKESLQFETKRLKESIEAENQRISLVHKLIKKAREKAEKRLSDM